MYSVTILGNVEQCRTEAEISDSEGTLLAVVYQTSDGWHTGVFVEELHQTATDFQAAVENAKQSLSHYVNRRGENPPDNATRGAFSLWLMVKDDGTAMGVRRTAVLVNAETGMWVLASTSPVSRLHRVEPPVWYKNILVRATDEIHPQSGHLVRILPNNRFGATCYEQGDEHTVGAGGAL